MDLVWVKVITMVLTGVIPILLSLLPFCFKSYVQRSDSKKKASFALSGTLTSCLLCFGAGVLLATSFVHILPEVSESSMNLGYKFGISHVTPGVTWLLKSGRTLMSHITDFLCL